MGQSCFCYITTLHKKYFLSIEGWDVEVVRVFLNENGKGKLKENDVYSQITRIFGRCRTVKVEGLYQNKTHTNFFSNTDKG